MNTTIRSQNSSTLESNSTLETNCPVCGSRSAYVTDVPGWGQWRQCYECTLEFAHPLRLGYDPMVLFNDAYQGKVQKSAMTDFCMRVDQRRVIIGELDDPSLWFWTTAFYDVLSWLKQHFRAGSTVLELGCGLGFFLHALRKEGFRAVGLDVAQTVVELNRGDGFDVWHGPVESMPAGWIQPDVVVSFFMLHHLEDPLKFLRTVREKAPTAPLAIAVYGPTNKGMAASLPPRTLIRWNAQSLARALTLAGYKPRMHEVQSSGVEHRLFRRIRKTLSRSMRLPWVYQIGKQAERYIIRRLPKQIRYDAYVILAFAEPTGSIGHDIE
jgi:SAM-dependent methyltransferase